MEFGQKKFREIDLFDFMKFFGLDFCKFSGPLCIYIQQILYVHIFFTFLSGLFGVYFVSNGTTPIDTFIQHLQEKWMSMCNSLSDFEVERAKNSLRTNMLLQLDGTTAICEDIGNILF